MLCTGAQVTRVTSQITITNEARLKRTTLETTLKNNRRYIQLIFIDDQVSDIKLSVFFLGYNSGAQLKKRCD